MIITLGRECLPSLLVGIKITIIIILITTYSCNSVLYKIENTISHLHWLCVLQEGMPEFWFLFQSTPSLLQTQSLDKWQKDHENQDSMLCSPQLLTNKYTIKIWSDVTSDVQKNVKKKLLLNILRVYKHSYMFIVLTWGKVHTFLTYT